MRRSGAPSAQSSAKRLRFLTPFVNRERECFNLDQENEFITSGITDSKPQADALNTFTNSSENPVSSKHGREAKSEVCRSTDEILKLISESVSEEVNMSPTAAHNSQDDRDEIPIFGKTTHQDFEEACFKKQHTAPNTSKVKVKINTDISQAGQLENSKKGEAKQKQSPERNDDEFPSSRSECDSKQTNSLSFSVMYCKRSSKKHKVWEGDGVLVFCNQSAILKDMGGKVIDRGMGYKLKQIEELEEGSKFCIGGKECEIQCRISVKNTTPKDPQSPVAKSIPNTENKKNSM